jgi:ubiquinone/menaquinone biosynthesis C-methylase UbiE/glycosyltransferase involved in cell wall biosynthesis
MRVLVATDAWHPQGNGVVRTLTSLAHSARRLGVTIDFLTPEGFPTFPILTYPGLRLALPRRHRVAQRIETAKPDAIHIATEGPIGHMVRGYCRRQGRRFTTSYTTRFPEYISARAPIPEAWIYAALRRFHAAATVTMVSTQSLMTELSERGFANLGMWTRGVDTDLFRPERASELDFPRPIFVTMGRLAVEKNLEAFLSLDLPGTKVVIGTGPQETALKRRFPDARFLGLLENGALAVHLAAADVFVFPSRTDTFGVVQLERKRRLPGHGPKGRCRRPARRSFERRPARGVYRGASHFSRGLSRLRAYSVVGKQRASIHRTRPNSGLRRVPRTRRGNCDDSTLCRANEHLANVLRRMGRQKGSTMTSFSYAELDKQTIAKAYARWAPVYDLVFGAVFERGRQAAIAAAERIGGRILEVGVGTGISLPDYSRGNRVCGVDISEPMLRKAQQRVDELGLTNVEGLWVMDAEHLSFPDASFDVVVAQYVITTVPNPEATLDEFARVLKPGGEIVLVSRVGAEAGLRRALERWFAPAARKLGWRTEFAWERYAHWAAQCHGMRLIERRAMPPFGHFSLIRFAKTGAATPARAGTPSARAAA